MKNFSLNTLIIITILTTANTFAAIANTHPTNNDPTEKKRYVLKKGTKISLQLNVNISSQDNEEGNIVEMMVLVDVKSDGQQLVKEGTFAVGEITSARKAGIFGRGGTIEFKGTTITTIDGQRVPIESGKIKKRGRNKKTLAYGASILLPVMGLVIGTPLLTPLVVVGLLVKGKEIEIGVGELIEAKIMEDVVIYI